MLGRESFFADASMSTRNRQAPTRAQMAAAAESALVNSMHTVDLGEGSTGFPTTSVQHPLRRTIVATVRATISELITKSNAAVWSPSEAQCDKMFKQRKFTTMNGNTAMLGDLRSVVLHSATATTMRSTFPVAVGASITGVDETYFSSTGRPFSLMAIAETTSTTPIKLQEEDVTVAYDFASRYPGFTADNLESNGIYAVPARKFVLVSTHHPLMTAIAENQAKLQMSEVHELPDQLVKISTDLYERLMPLVKEQVTNQIKVADFTHMAVKIAPADFSSWNEVSDKLTSEAVAPIKAEHRRALKRVSGDSQAQKELDMHYQEKIEQQMQKIANTAYEFSVEMQMDYNFLHPDEGAEDVN